MLQFRKAKISDIEVLRSLAKEIWFSAYKDLLSVEQINYMLDMMYSSEVIEKEISDNILWEIMEINQVPVGLISVIFKNNEAKLNKLYLKDQFQGKGFGQFALSHVIEVSRLNKSQRLYLNVNKQNEKGIKAYEKMGFKLIDSGVFDIGNGYVMDDFIYSLIL